MKRRIGKWFWGILFLLCAVVLLANRLELFHFGGINIWNVMLSVLLAAWLVDSILRRKIEGVLFSVAFLIIANDSLLGLEAITPWPVLFAALLATIGLHILFPNLKRGKFRHGIDFEADIPVLDQHGDDGGKVSFVRNGNSVHCENSFGEGVKYLDGYTIKDAHLESSFGCMTVYFDNAILEDNHAAVHAEVSFGKMILYIPSDWQVHINTDSAFGSVEERGRCNPNGEKVLDIYGEASFGSLEIRYV